MDIKPTTVLQRVPELNVQVFSNDCVQISIHGQTIESGVHTLPVLSAFTRPRTLEQALRQLQATAGSVEDWAALTGTIVNLAEVGVLRDPSDASPTLRAAESGFDAAHIHIKMLNDRDRTSSYLAAIREVVRPGDVVVDIGTGTGVLSIAAAKAGARHVFAVEATAVGKVAEAVFEANGLSDRITLVPGWSSQIDLPERADVLVSEIIGNEPLGEQVLETTRDALQRLLKPDARLIPGRVKIYGIPVGVDEAERAKHVFTAGAVNNWGSWYAMNFQPLAQLPRTPYLFFIKPTRAASWPALAEPLLLADIDLKNLAGPTVDVSETAEIDKDGSITGIIMYFDLELSPGVVLSTHPGRVDENCSWGSPVWLLPEPLQVGRGDHIRVAYQHRVSTQPSTVSVTRVPAE